MNNHDHNLISSYSRAQSIEDGVLIDITPYAALAGFKHPVAITAGVHSKFFHEPVGEGKITSLTMDGQSATTSLLSAKAGVPLLSALFNAVKAIPSLPAKGSMTDRIYFEHQGVKLWSLCGPGDTPAPVITIMLEGED